MAERGDAPRPWHRNLIETAPVPVVVYDADHVLRYVNDAAVEFVNETDRRAVVGQRAADFVHPDDRAELAERIERVLDEREPVPPTELRFVAATGERKHAVVAGAPVTYEGEPAGQAVLNDVTERKRRERQLRRERDRFALLFENLPSAVVHGVAEDGVPVVERVNRRFEEVFGYASEEIEGENLDDYIVPDDRRAEAEQLNRRILSEGRVQTEVSRETVDGVREFLLTLVIDDLDAETPEGYSIYTDITEQKRTQRRLERQNERLEEFASMVAHDLRNPLNVATAAAEQLRATSDDSRVDRIVTAQGRMEQIIDDLLTLARQSDPVDAPTPVDVETVATRAWETVDTVDADLTVAETWQIRADGSRLQELFENLFRNAVEHGVPSDRAADGDGVEADANGGAAADGVTVTVGRSADGFYVADDGVGVPAARREDVFDAGYTTAADGTGLGLAIVEHIATAHGWDAGVAESESGGARFEFSGVDTA